jgi:hypothetical protein
MPAKVRKIGSRIKIKEISEVLGYSREWTGELLKRSGLRLRDIYLSELVDFIVKHYKGK